MLAINAGAHSFEVANPRHYHEWRIWEDVKLPDGKILIPGLHRPRHQLRRAPGADRRLHRQVRRPGRAGERDRRRRLRLLVTGQLRARGAPDGRVAQVPRPRRRRRPRHQAALRSRRVLTRSQPLMRTSATRRHEFGLRRPAVEVDDALGAVDGDRLAGLDDHRADLRADHRRAGRTRGPRWRECDSTPPTSVTTAPAIENSGTHGGSVISHTMTSPSSRSLASGERPHDAGRAGVRAGRAGHAPQHVRVDVLLRRHHAEQAEHDGVHERIGRLRAAAAACRGRRAG